jgi:hypothetical protein
MATGADELRRFLRFLLDLLEAGDPLGALEAIDSRGAAGDEQLVRRASAFRSMAWALLRRMQGRMDEASDLLDETTAQLPPMLRGTSPSGRPSAVVPREPSDPDGDAHLTWRLARLCHDQQIDLEGFRETLAPGRAAARAVLVEACIEYMRLIEFNRSACRPRNKQSRDPDETLPVEPTRKALCDRATALRRLGDPTALRVSQSVWRDVGGLEGLRAEALDVLAKRPEPARRCGREEAAGAAVRSGYEWAWAFARDGHVTG